MQDTLKDLVGGVWFIDIYSGTPLLWTPWGTWCEVSCIERCSHLRDKVLERKCIWRSVLYREVS